MEEDQAHFKIVGELSDDERVRLLQCLKSLELNYQMTEAPEPEVSSTADLLRDFAVLQGAQALTLSILLRLSKKASYTKNNESRLYGVLVANTVDEGIIESRSRTARW